MNLEGGLMPSEGGMMTSDGGQYELRCEGGGKGGSMTSQGGNVKLEIMRLEGVIIPTNFLWAATRIL